MTDAQMFTLFGTFVVTFFAVGLGVLFNSSRLNDVKEVLRAELRANAAEMATALVRIENKLDHLAEIVAGHSERLDKP